MCCHSSLSSNCLLTIRPRSWPSPTVAIEGHSKVMAVAKGRLTRLPSGCSSAIEPSHRNASVCLSLQCPSAMMQSRWRRAMDRPPRSQEPSVLRDFRVHEATPPRSQQFDIAVDRGAARTSTSIRLPRVTTWLRLSKWRSRTLNCWLSSPRHPYIFNVVLTPDEG